MNAKFLLAVLAASPTFAAVPVTFYKDVLPILQRRCQACHRPGEAAPMSLLTYRDARPWAKAMREAVLLKRMPPWFADSRYGKYRNDLSLSKLEIDTIAAWADGGAHGGDPLLAPKPVAFKSGWQIGEPDVVFELPELVSVPASGVLDYQYYSVPTKFTEDRWVERAEVRPTSRAVVHHAIVNVSDAMSDEGFGARRFLAGYAPGAVPQIWKPGEARLIPAGATLVFQMHYTANGREAVDRTRIGLVFARKPPTRRIIATSAGNQWFEIPPGAPDYRVDSSTVVREAAELIGMRPHMHLRGKSFEYRVVFPNADSRVVLSVPRYDFNWQPYYYLEAPLALPTGTRIECTAHYDNSSSNPRNPDATVAVRWGPQSWQEMMLGWIDLAVPFAAPAKTGATRSALH